MQFKVLIGDDEEGVRLVLKKAIDKIDGFEVVAEAADGEEALMYFEKLRTEVVFLDVEMPKLTGIEVAKKIMDINPQTIIIFVTGHQKYMPAAFETYAFDYIIKPFKIDRLYKTLDRVKLINQKNNEEAIYKILKQEKGLEKLIIKNKEGISFLDMKDIIIIQREERSTVIYTQNESYLTSDSLSDVEVRLDEALFFRSHKSYIINLSKISKIFPYGRWTYIVKLHSTDKDALLTHEKYEELKKMF